MVPFLLKDLTLGHQGVGEESRQVAHSALCNTACGGGEGDKGKGCLEIKVMEGKENGAERGKFLDKDTRAKPSSDTTYRQIGRSKPSSRHALPYCTCTIPASVLRGRQPMGLRDLWGFKPLAQTLTLLFASRASDRARAFRLCVAVHFRGFHTQDPRGEISRSH